MTENSKTVGKKYIIAIISTVVLVAIVIFVLFILLDHDSSNDVVIGGQMHYEGVKCENNILIHPALADYKPTSLKNTISAVFLDDELSTITYQYDGVYSSAEEAKNAEAFAAAAYNKILAKKYNERIDIFSHNFRLDGMELSLTITAKGDEVTQKNRAILFARQHFNISKNDGGFVESLQE